MSEFAIRIDSPPEILKRDAGPWYAPDLATAKKIAKYRANYVFEHGKCSCDIVIFERGIEKCRYSSDKWRCFEYLGLCE